MRNALLFVTGILVWTGAAWAQAPQVTQVSAQQFGSFVRIEYDLSGPADTPIAVSLAASNDGGQLFSLPLSEVHGDVGVHLSPGTGKVAIWDAGTDLPDSVNPDVRIWVKTWIPEATPVTLDNTDFVFVYADGPDTGGTLRETQLPGFYVTPCVVSTGVDAPAIPQTLADAYPDYAFEMFQDTVAGETWDSLRARTPWADAPTLTCTEATGWRIAAYYWPSNSGAPATPDLGVRPWALGNDAATSASFALDTTTILRDLDGDGMADDKTDRDQDFVLDVLEDFNGNGQADAFEDANHDQVADGYGTAGTGETALAGFADANENQLPDFFESLYAITSSTHPRGDRVYFNGSFAAVINDYLPGAAGYRWRIAEEETVTLEAGDNALSGPGPHAITAEPGDGIHYLHVAAVDGSDALIAGSERRFLFNSSLQAPMISSETHPDPDQTSDRHVFGARLEMPYGPKVWQSETGDAWDIHRMLAFHDALWALQLDGSVWQSSDGFHWRSTAPLAPWADADNLSAAVFKGQLWVYTSKTESGPAVMGQCWTSADGLTWTEKAGIPWANRQEPALRVFRDALYVFGGVAYLEDGTPAAEIPVWRSEDGDTWQEVTGAVPWASRNAPNIAVFGDSLWLNGVPAAFAAVEVTADAWRSWDGVHWSPVVVPVPEEPLPVALPAEGAWRGWDNALWRYYGYPGLGILTAFDESLWYAGSDPRLPEDASNAGDIWYYDGGRNFSRAVESFNPPALYNTSVASYLGRLHVIGPIGKDTLHSEFGDRWYNSALYEMRMFYFATLVTFNGKLFDFGRYAPRVFDGRTIYETTYYATEMENRQGPGLVVFNGELWCLGGYLNGTFKHDVLRTADARTWTTVTSNAPWPRRAQHGAVAFDGAMWLIGGDDGLTYYNDVWRSPDGETWTQVVDHAPWAARAEAGVSAYDGALWVIGGNDATMHYHDAWRSDNGVDWEPVDTGAGTFTGVNATLHQDSLYLLTEKGSQPRPVRRYGAARATTDSVQGMRFTIDQSPDTLPDTAPLDPNTYLVSGPLTPGDYWLHVGMVDSLGQLGTVTHRAIHVLPIAGPVVTIDGRTNASQYPGNAMNIRYDNHQWLPNATNYVGLNASPGGDADMEVPGSDFTLPCVAEGTYWLVAQSVDLYGVASERTEREITVGPRSTLFAPTMHFVGMDPATEDKKHVYTATGRDISMTPDRLSGDTAYYVIDQRYGLPTDFSAATPVPNTGFPVPMLGVGRHYFHAVTLDNCDLPSKESVLSALVLQGAAPYVDLGKSLSTGPVVLDIAFSDEISKTFDVRYVVDHEPNTDPTIDSTPFMAKHGQPPLEIPVPEEDAWDFYVHLAEVEGPNHLSRTAHFLFRKDETGFVAVQGPYYSNDALVYQVSSPGVRYTSINPAFVRVLPLVNGVRRKVSTTSISFNNTAILRIDANPPGPAYVEFPLGSLSAASGLLPATGPTATGYLDETSPTLLMEGPAGDTLATEPLVFQFSAPDADDLYMPSRVFTLVQYPSKKLTARPQVEMEDGIWTVTFNNVAQYGTVRLEVPRYDPNTKGEVFTDCIGYDWSGNCVNGTNSEWLDFGTTGPELTITPPSPGKFGTGPVQYILQFNKPTVNTLDVNALELESDPPGAITAAVSIAGSGRGRYIVTLSDIHGDGDVQLRVPAGFAVDQFGAESTDVLSDKRKVDTTPPQIVFDAPVLPETLGDPVEFTFRIEGSKSEPTFSPRLLKTGNLTAKMVMVKLGSSAGTYRYKATVSNYLGKGTVQLEVPGTGIVDDVSNVAETTRSEEVALGVYRVTITASGDGTTVPAPDFFLYPADTLLQLQAIPSGNGQFERWSIRGIDSFLTTNEVLVDGELKAHAYFTGSPKHTADFNRDGHINLTEVLRMIQIYNSGGFRCVAPGTPSEDGYAAGPGPAHDCEPHAADYSPQNWSIGLSELLRMVQFYNADGYAACEWGEDGFCAVITR